MKLIFILMTLIGLSIVTFAVSQNTDDSKVEVSSDLKLNVGIALKDSQQFK